MNNMDELFATYVTVKVFNKYNTRLKPGVSILSKKDLFSPPTPELLSRKSLRFRWKTDDEETWQHVHPLNRIHSKVPSNRRLAHETNIQQGSAKYLI